MYSTFMSAFFRRRFNQSRIIATFLFLFTNTLILAQEFKEVKGKVSLKGDPIAGATIINKTSKDPESGKEISTLTNSKGEFTILAQANDHLIINFVGFEALEVTVTSFTDLDIQLQGSSSNLSSVLVSSISQRSSWVGAKIGYNLDGITEDNSFIGSAKISINPLADRFAEGNGAPYISIIGNFGDFISNTNKDSVKKQLASLTQSVQGLSIGIGSVWELPIGIGSSERNKIFFRPYVTSSYRLNTFTKVGPDSSTVNLSQIRTSIGIEFEGLTFSRGGVMNLSIEGSLTNFGVSRYQKIFNEKRKNLKSVETTLILPISNLIGFFVNGTFSPGLNAIYLIGIIVKPK